MSCRGRCFRSGISGFHSPIRRAGDRIRHAIGRLGPRLRGAAGRLPDPGFAAAYRLAWGDEVEVRIVDEPEYERARLRLDERGLIRVPWAGDVKADGKTTSELEIELERRFATYFHEPLVQARISEYAGRPVSVIGAVKKPGVHQLRGPRTLVEVLALAGGLTPNAGHVIKITRPLGSGRIPLPTARDDPSGRFSVASASVEDLLKAERPAENILIEPGMYFRFRGRNSCT